MSITIYQISLDLRTSGDLDQVELCGGCNWLYFHFWMNFSFKPTRGQWRGTVFSDRRLANSLFSRITMSFLMESRWATICCSAISCQHNRLHHVTEYIYFTPVSCSTTRTDLVTLQIITLTITGCFCDFLRTRGSDRTATLQTWWSYRTWWLLWIKQANRIWKSLTKVNLA